MAVPGSTRLLPLVLVVLLGCLTWLLDHAANLPGAAHVVTSHEVKVGRHLHANLTDRTRQVHISYTLDTPHFAKILAFLRTSTGLVG